MIQTTDQQGGEQLALEDQADRPEVALQVVPPGMTVTAAGFPCTRGERLIDGGRRPARWLDNAIEREHQITKAMGLLDGPQRGARRVA